MEFEDNPNSNFDLEDLNISEEQGSLKENSIKSNSASSYFDCLKKVTIMLKHMLTSRFE